MNKELIIEQDTAEWSITQIQREIQVLVETEDNQDVADNEHSKANKTKHRADVQGKKVCAGLRQLMRVKPK